MPETKTEKRKIRRPPFGAPHVLVLAVVDGEEPFPVHRVSRQETIVGRGDEADFRIDDDEISNRHCLVRADGPVVTLTDLDSTNGTRLNGRAMKGGVAQRLRHLDEIALGGTRLFVLAGTHKPRD